MITKKVSFLTLVRKTHIEKINVTRFARVVRFYERGNRGAFLNGFLNKI